MAWNVHLIKYGEKPHNKTLWKVYELDHEAILETLKCRVDPVGSLDWTGREGEREEWSIGSKYNVGTSTPRLSTWQGGYCYYV